MTIDKARLGPPQHEVAGATQHRYSVVPHALSWPLPYLIVIVLCVLILVPVWHLRGADLTVPLGLVGDNSLSQEMVAVFVRDGHFYVNPLLGAPGQQELYDFPLLPWTQLIVLAPIKLLTSDPGLAINLFYFLGYPLVAVTSLYVLRRLGISTGLAIAGAVLYAFIPFHQLRNEGHLVYSGYYFVPLMVMVAIWVSTGHELFNLSRKAGNVSTRWLTRDGLVSLLICVFVGWDNPYYAFFGAALLAVAGLLGCLRSPKRHSLLAAAILLVTLLLSFGVGLLPSIMYVHQHGRAAAAQRLPQESEIFGLTLVQMLAPVTNHRIPAFAQWKSKFNGSAILVNENDTATLGVVGSAGFLSLLVCVFLKECPDILYSLSILNLFSVLLGTIGGLGAVFSFVVSSQLRAFNRVSVYISFFSIAALLLILDRISAKYVNRRSRAVSMVVLPSLLLLIGIPDQIPHGLQPNRDLVEKQFKEEAQFVQQIERLVPPHTMIFQLPYDIFPESPPIQRMSNYDELKGYLHSGSLRWSYGAMRGRADDKWVASVSREPVDQMLLSIAAAGFGGIYIDRYGYSDSAASLEAQIQSLLGSQPIVSKGGRLSFFLLDGNAVAALDRQVPPERRASLENALHPLLVGPGEGCWDREGSDTDNWHWCGRHATIDILNASKSERKILLEATFVTWYPTNSTLMIEGSGVQQKLTVNNSGTLWQAVVTVPPGEQAIKLSSDAKQVLAPADSREMFFRINNFHSRELHP